MQHNQFELLRQRRFLPFFLVQALGAFNDNVFRQAIIGMLFWPVGTKAESDDAENMPRKPNGAHPPAAADEVSHFVQ